MRIGTLLGALVLALVGAVPAAAAEPRQKIHLGEGPGGLLQWSVDPADLGTGPVERECGLGDRPLPTQVQVCGGGTAGGRVWQLNFYPGSVFDAPVEWGPSAPLRFRIALKAVPLTPDPYTVHLSYDDGGPAGSARSAPAVEVAPGVWEGELTQGGPIDQAAERRVPILGVTVKTESRGADLTLDPANTWIELPQAVPASGMREMAQQSPPGAFTVGSPHHRFTMTDDRFSLQSFGPMRGTNDLVLDIQETSDVIVWAEARNAAYLSDPGDPRSHWRPFITLRRDGAQIHEFAYERAGAVAVTPGPLSVRANQALWGADGVPYTLHVLTIQGPRTLRSMEWDFAPTSPVAKTPFVSACGSTTEPVPVSGAVTSFRVHLDWTTTNPAEKWSPAWRSRVLGDNVCYPPALGRETTIVELGRRLAYVGYGASQDSAFASSNTTTFTMRVDFTHRPY